MSASHTFLGQPLPPGAEKRRHPGGRPRRLPEGTPERVMVRLSEGELKQLEHLQSVWADKIRESPGRSRVKLETLIVVDGRYRKPVHVKQGGVLVPRYSPDSPSRVVMSPSDALRLCLEIAEATESGRPVRLPWKGEVLAPAEREEATPKPPKPPKSPKVVKPKVVKPKVEVAEVVDLPQAREVLAEPEHEPPEPPEPPKSPTLRPLTTADVAELAQMRDSVCAAYDGNPSASQGAPPFKYLYDTLEAEQPDWRTKKGVIDQLTKSWRNYRGRVSLAQDLIDRFVTARKLPQIKLTFADLNDRYALIRGDFACEELQALVDKLSVKLQ